MPAQSHADHVVDLDLAAGADAQVALDAGVKLHRHRGMAEVLVRSRITGREAAVGDLQLVGPVPEVGVGVVRLLPRRLVADQQFEHQLARRLGALARGVDLHARLGLADAARGQDALALHLHHAGAAVAIRAIARRRSVAEVRDLGATAVGDLPDGFAGACLDFFTVEEESDRLAHVRSSGKCFMIILMGFMAA